MSRMSNLDYTIRNWYKDYITYIIATIVVLALGLCIYVQADKDIKRAVEKENRIKRIEKMLQEYEEGENI